MVAPLWSFGDKVVHAQRPEWGTGIVAAAAADSFEGRPCQRLTVRFDRAGLKTLSTALADIRAATDQVDAEPAELNGSAVEPHDDARVTPQAFLQIPESARDPFTPLAARLRATLGLYRFNEHGGSLLDWAAAQSGLKDPMSRFNRHELEQLFRRFAAARDEHFKRLVMDMKRKDPAALQAGLRSAPAAAQQALRRLDIGR